MRRLGQEAELPELLYRVGRLPDALAWPDWHYVGGGRYDDPQRQFRTLYAAEQRLACLVELLAVFRPSPEALSRLKAVVGASQFTSSGVVPADWSRRRCWSAFRLKDGQHWLDLRAMETRETLRIELSERLVQLGMADLDVGAVRGPRREITQDIARLSHERGYAGLAYRSRFDDALDCWAIFEGAEFEPVGVSEPIVPDDPDLAKAAVLLGLRVER